MHDRPAGSGPGNDFFSGGEADDSGSCTECLEMSAVRLHEANQRRILHFNSAVLADSAMDILVSLLIARLHRRPVTGTALAMANRIPPEKCVALLSELAQAGLVTGNGGQGPVDLTEQADRQLRAYLQQR